LFFTLKKKYIFFALGSLFATIAALGGFAGYRAANSRSHSGMTIVIDAGHGGRDGGVTGVNTGIKESDLNLAIARSLKHFFVLHGYNVVMTREGHEGLYGSAPAGSRKKADFEARRQIINRAAPDLVISIHLNGFPIRSVRGAHVFYSHRAQGGIIEVAESIQSSLNNNLEASTRSAARGDYFILNSTEYPSVLVEGGYLSNPEDERLLITAAYQERLAYAIFCGVHALVVSGEWPF